MPPPQSTGMPHGRRDHGRGHPGLLHWQGDICIPIKTKNSGIHGRWSLEPIDDGCSSSLPEWMLLNTATGNLQLLMRQGFAHTG